MREQNGKDTARQWVRIGRDAVIVIVGSFMLIWQTVFATVPNPLLIGAGLVLLGVPSVLRFDDFLSVRKDDRHESP